MLDHLLVATPEEELVPVFVEVRKENRTADVAADVIEAGRIDFVRRSGIEPRSKRSGLLLIDQVPIVRIPGLR